MVIYLERGVDLHMAQLMLLPLTVSCFSKIQIGFTFLVPLTYCVCVCEREREKATNTTVESCDVISFHKQKLTSVTADHSVAIG